MMYVLPKTNIIITLHACILFIFAELIYYFAIAYSMIYKSTGSYC